MQKYWGSSSDGQRGIVGKCKVCGDDRQGLVSASDNMDSYGQTC